ncbi:bifunctional 3-demethylubiquinone-9 3-methyltransferase/ 2-octaprenyl-6-hydroxy phenol methylase [Roseimaritima multifibrata]|uniref:Bifunctional 3-demethylubiquinone-9 3-methyltransferase/ 2-octaprenyl-6-hydroxy phenol methylase n=1 Tax=Roseimaritima multifibrata TaxID=1930274 RepID=A0A517M998_9BACT|nr:class I SAM-dependent methyltransferase [Roseimaritima multifibrata]QDS91452.1 bifunctional 3-demethylubiquinone-9 3-methyltransferase/ 2-octaprenyl-6-hydroxy phenol methylase [Roseimaritima multifibrata]
MDETKLNTLVGSVLHDLGGAFIVPLVQIGERLGIYEKLNELGPSTSHELAESTGLAERYLAEWLCAQAASNYIAYDAEAGKFSMTPEQAFVFANRSSPFYLAPAFGAAAAFQDNEPQVREAFQTGSGVSWGDQTHCLSCAVARFFRPGYENHLIQAWLPSIEGMIAKLEKGIRVADVGCGHGITTTIMAQVFPNSEFIGFDFHKNSIEEARKHAASHELTNVRFEVALAKELPGKYSLVTVFDCLHDMGDPIGGMEHIHAALESDGTCMIVEPMAGDTVAENMNPVSRLYYAASTMVCVPTSLAQETGAALGAQAGEKRLKEIILEGAGFSHCRRIAETPFNIVLQAQP